MIVDLESLVLKRFDNSNEIKATIQGCTVLVRGQRKLATEDYRFDGEVGEDNPFSIWYLVDNNASFLITETTGNIKLTK